jgi:hypothetical protein
MPHADARYVGLFGYHATVSMARLRMLSGKAERGRPGEAQAAPKTPSPLKSTAK